MPHGIHTAFSMIGAGRLASTLVRALADKGVRPVLIASRTGVSAVDLAVGCKGSVGSAFSEIREIPTRLVIVSVSDNALSTVSERLANGLTDWTGRIVLHTSGTWTSEALSALADRGAAVGSFHPIQTFAKNGPETKAGTLFLKTPIAVEGSEQAVEAGLRLAELLGASAFEVDAATKIQLHLASVMASNYLVTLLALAEEIAEHGTGVAGGTPALFQSLSLRAVSNVADLGATNSLTGPIARGDYRVLEAHLERLSASMPHFLPVYAALATETIRLAVRSGATDHERGEVMLDMIQQHLAAVSE